MNEGIWLGLAISAVLFLMAIALELRFIRQLLERRAAPEGEVK